MQKNSTNTKQQVITLKIPKADLLPDKGQWCNRFEIRSETSDRLYVVSQHKEKEHWGCSCPGWRRFRKCKHLENLGLPNYEQPYPVNLVNV